MRGRYGRGAHNEWLGAGHQGGKGGGVCAGSHPPMIGQPRSQGIVCKGVGREAIVLVQAVPSDLPVNPPLHRGTFREVLPMRGASAVPHGCGEGAANAQHNQ